MKSCLMHKTTDTAYLIPKNFQSYCSLERNSYRGELFESPVYFKNEHGEYAVATDGYGCIITELPFGAGETKRAYLNLIAEERLTFASIIDGVLKTEPNLFNVDIPKLRLSLAAPQFVCKGCNNSKQATCSDCEGSTEVECGECNGEGSFPCITCSKPDQCKKCDGLGVVECMQCEEGITSCPDCLYPVNKTVELRYGDNRCNFRKDLLQKYTAPLKADANCFFEGSRIIFADDVYCVALMPSSNLADITVDLGELCQKPSPL